MPRQKRDPAASRPSPYERAGSEAVNATVARAAQLAAVAALPLAVGLTGDAYRDPVQLTDGFSQAMTITAVLAAVGGVLAFALIRNPVQAPPEEEAPEPCYFCGVEGPRLDTAPSTSRAAPAA